MKEFQSPVNQNNKVKEIGHSTKNNSEDEEVSMMDLVRQMQEKQKEQENSDHNENDSSNDSFSSNDILEALDYQDLTTARTAADTVANPYEEMNEEELKVQIESLLLPNLDRPTFTHFQSEPVVKPLRANDPNIVDTNSEFIGKFH